MASASQSFPSRPFSNTLHGKLPERGGGGGGGFGVSTAARGTGMNQQQQQQSGMNSRSEIVGGLSTSGGNVPNITDEQREEINEAFALFDLDKDQRIDYHEFKVSLKALGFTLSKPDLLTLLTTHGVSPTPAQPSLKRPSHPAPEPVHPSRLLITQQSFQQIAGNLISQRNPRDEIMRAFELFDSEGKGVITVEDLRRVARELGEGLEEDEMRAMIEEFDMEGKGGVDREEFVSICLG